MSWATLRRILFFCCQASDESQDRFDESAHLIPTESVESPLIYSDVVLLDQQQLQKRLGLIVRTKEGKMVNVASQIPFNLHNKVIPPERSYGSVSRSASGSIDHHSRVHDYQNDYGYSNHGIARHRHFYVSAHDDRRDDRSRSVSPSADGPSSHTRYHSQTLDQPMPTPILNVRLVGYTANTSKTRGRARERESHSTEVPDPIQGTTQVEGESAATGGITETSCEDQGPSTASTFKLRDVGSITLSWND
ncbi:hypothetical protein BYT27DRAFT_7213621 [Phlegmacium glaucopus]|nr:hypothetical protein BYT27DRAFT_7213621 [Phlegmacium glaucopus]